MSTAQFVPIEAKSGITRAPLPDPFFACLYRCLAPYRGCAHACRYCDGRAEKYYVEGDFERDIAARTNLSELVAKNVEAGLAAREFGAIGLGSGVTDVYQPIERELGLTRRVLEALVPTALPIVILTKSDLILRDFDILARFPRALVMVTVTTTDPEKARILEPGASPPDQRLEVIRRARKRASGRASWRCRCARASRSLRKIPSLFSPRHATREPSSSMQEGSRSGGKAKGPIYRRSRTRALRRPRAPVHGSLFGKPPIRHAARGGPDAFRERHPRKPCRPRGERTHPPFDLPRYPLRARRAFCPLLPHAKPLRDARCGRQAITRRDRPLRRLAILRPVRARQKEGKSRCIRSLSRFQNPLRYARGSLRR